MAPCSWRCRTPARATASLAGATSNVLREAIVVADSADFAVETMVDPAPPHRRQHRVRRRLYRRLLTRAISNSDTSATRTTNEAPNAIAEDPDAAASRDDTDLDENAESDGSWHATWAEIIAEEDHALWLGGREPPTPKGPR